MYCTFFPVNPCSAWLMPCKLYFMHKRAAHRWNSLKGLAPQELASGGDRVVICGRDEARLTAATAALRRAGGPGANVHGFRCDVSNGHGAPASRTAHAALLREFVDGTPGT